MAPNWVVARLRKQRVGLNRGLPRVWGLYAWRLTERAWIGRCEGASEGVRDVVESAGEVPGDRGEGFGAWMTPEGRAIVLKER